MSTYMDDSMESVENENIGKELYFQLTQLWEAAGMRARKWFSNSEEVLSVIPKEHRAKEIQLTENGVPSVKTLGLIWQAERDKFTFKGGSDPEEGKKLTKREVLSRIASVYDPLGFIAPVIVKAKILMQEIWAVGLGWDEPLPEVIRDKVVNWETDLMKLGDVQVDRCLCPHNDKEVELHTFVDASNNGYGAVVYLKCGNNGDASVTLVASKTKVAPLKSMSIPRLELLGAVLGLKLSLTVAKVLSYDVKQGFYWSDSMNVLWWVRGHSRNFKPFVAHRIGEIQESTNPDQWRYVPSGLNPADIASRGCSVNELVQDDKWWHGPEFLKGPREGWPENKIEKKEMACTEQRKQFSFLSRIMPETSDDQWRLNPSRFSNWGKLVRVLAYVIRFVTNCRARRMNREVGKLSLDEIRDSEIALIKQAQKDEYSKEIECLKKGQSVSVKSQVSALYPRLDKDGVVRGTGRLSLNDSIPYDVKYPIVLPRRHVITKLIVKSYHELGNHVAGINHILAMLSERFWIVSAREEIRECEHQCNVCKRRKATAGQQIMAPLPTVRTQMDSLKAFTRVSVDYAGPFLTKQGRGRIQRKRYLCLITCLATRAVHLELAYSLDTDSFINAFFRFVSRRGQPKVVFSDNGSNFIGAERELKELTKFSDQDRIQEESVSKGFRWNFNPPLTPHFGGAHESLVKSAKRALYAILGKADISDEELHSAIVGAEGLLNSRPLTYQSASAKDTVPLTPNHFLHGQMGGRFAADVQIDTTQFNPRKRWRRVQELVRHFWDRWLREWIPTLNQRKKWREKRRDLRVKDMVLLKEKDSLRGQWPLGRVTEVYPGPDGHVRVIKVKTSKGEFTRGISQVYPLEYVD